MDATYIVKPSISHTKYNVEEILQCMLTRASSVTQYQLRLGKQRQVWFIVRCEIPWERVPYLSALEVRSRQGAIQIHVYLYLTRILQRKTSVQIHQNIITVPVRWLPVNSKSSSWSQCFRDRVDNGVALANSRLAKCQSSICRSRDDRYTSLNDNNNTVILGTCSWCCHHEHIL